MSKYTGYDQCDQIGQNFDIWATLGYFLLNKFSNTKAVSTLGPVLQKILWP
jgi:hypothetical protein